MANAMWRHGSFVQFCSQRYQSIPHGLSDRGWWRYGATFSHALHAIFGMRGGGAHMSDLDFRNFRSARQQIVAQGGSQWLSGFIVRNLFVQGCPDPLCNSTYDLSIHNQRI